VFTEVKYTDYSRCMVWKFYETHSYEL
jgi:hypothetical protein